MTSKITSVDKPQFVVRKLGQVCEIQAGGTPSRSKPEYWNGDIPWVKISDISKNPIISSTEESISQSGLENSSAKKFPPNTLLFTIFATLGEVGLLNVEAATNQAIAGLRILDNTLLDRDYLYYFLISLKNHVNGIGRGVAQKNINLSMLRDVDVPIPSKEKQGLVATTLRKIDDQISLRKKQRDKLEHLVKSQFIEMFGDTKSQSKFTKVSLKTLIQHSNNGLARRGNDVDGSIVVRLVELQDRYLDMSNPNRIQLTDKEKQKYLLEDQDILFARVNGNPDYVGRCAVFHDVYGEEIYHNDHTIRVRLDKNQVEAFYVCFYLSLPEGRGQIKQHIKTSAGQYTISQGGIEALSVLLPPLEMQRKFRRFAEQVDKSKFAVEESIRKLELLKKSLMQQYFG